MVIGAVGTQVVAVALGLALVTVLVSVSITMLVTSPVWLVDDEDKGLAPGADIGELKAGSDEREELELSKMVTVEVLMLRDSDACAVTKMV